MDGSTLSSGDTSYVTHLKIVVTTTNIFSGIGQNNHVTNLFFQLFIIINCYHSIINIYSIVNKTFSIFGNKLILFMTQKFLIFFQTHEINAIRENLALYKESVKNLFLNNL